MDAFLVRVPRAEADDVLRSAAAVRKVIESADGKADLHLNLGEYWAALTFMLSGEVPMPKYAALERGLSWDDDSLANVLMGGWPTPFMATFGPACYVAADQVALLAGKLAGLGSQAFKERYDAADLLAEDIPPGGWQDNGETLASLMRSFEELAAFYKKAAAQGDGMLIYIS